MVAYCCSLFFFKKKPIEKLFVLFGFYAIYEKKKIDQNKVKLFKCNAHRVLLCVNFVYLVNYCWLFTSRMIHMRHHSSRRTTKTTICLRK